MKIMKKCCEQTLERAITKLEQETKNWEAGRRHTTIFGMLFGLRRAKEMLEELINDNAES